MPPAKGGSLQGSFVDIPEISKNRYFLHNNKSGAGIRCLMPVSGSVAIIFYNYPIMRIMKKAFAKHNSKENFFKLCNHIEKFRLCSMKNYVIR